jgi:DNA adenine methylase
VQPLISYYGGKQKQLANILPLIPEHRVYVEPFAGGLAVFFAKRKARTEVINDMDQQLITLYRVMQDENKSEELIHRLGWTPYSRAEHSRAHTRNQTLHTDDVTKAWMYFVSVMQGFAYKKDQGWGYGLKIIYPAIFARKAAPARLRAIRDRLASVHIECNDALKVIEAWDSEDTLFYCDPPYPGTDCGHYKGYTHEDLSALVAKLSNIKGSFLLSNYAQEQIPETWERFEHTAVASSRRVEAGQARGAARTEIIWRKLNAKHKATNGAGKQITMDLCAGL